MRNNRKHNRHLAWLLFLILIAAAFTPLSAGCAAGTPSKDVPPEVAEILRYYPQLKNKPYEVVKVGRVVDGDTFETADKRKVRLIGVNTPETVKPGSPVERFGKEASSFTKKHLDGQTVVLFPDTADKDKYGRLLRYVFIPGKASMFNEILAAEGYANIMTIPPNVMFAKTFQYAERQARSKELGLWKKETNEGISEPPDEVKSGPPDTSPSCADPKIKGNINSKGEKIYHLPGDPSYDRTKPEAWFCSEDEAKAAGFRTPVKK